MADAEHPRSFGEKQAEKVTIYLNIQVDDIDCRIPHNTCELIDQVSVDQP
jgi:hypothetical protein